MFNSFRDRIRRVILCNLRYSLFFLKLWFIIVRLLLVMTRGIFRLVGVGVLEIR